jgi:hypothetical protein
VSVRELLLPDFAGMLAHRAGSSRHNRPSCRLDILAISWVFEIVC